MIMSPIPCPPEGKAHLNPPGGRTSLRTMPALRRVKQGLIIRSCADAKPLLRRGLGRPSLQGDRGFYFIHSTPVAENFITFTGMPTEPGVALDCAVINCSTNVTGSETSRRVPK